MAPNGGSVGESQRSAICQVKVLASRRGPLSALTRRSQDSGIGPGPLRIESLPDIRERFGYCWQLFGGNGKHLRLVQRVVGDDHERCRTVPLDVEPAISLLGVFSCRGIARGLTVPYQRQAEDVLRSLRGVERELEVVEPGSPQAEFLHLSAARLRAEYQQLILLAREYGRPEPPPLPKELDGP